MKILFIDPPFKRFTGFVNYYFPIGLAYIAAVLRQHKHEVAIFDVDALKKGASLDFSQEYLKLEEYRKSINQNDHPVWKSIADTLEAFAPDLVGITAITTKFGSVLKTAEIVKKTKPDCTIIVGGPHPTLLPDQTLKSKNIDIVVIGEGERTILNLVNALSHREPIENIKGIAFRKNQKIYFGPPQHFINDLNQIPFPARDLLLNKGNYTSEDMGVMMTSRGCPYNCSYCCHMWHKEVRNRSLDNIIAEIREVKQSYRTEQFEFKDDTFTLNKKRTYELCEKIISEKIRLNWGCSTRADLLDDSLIKMMKKAGCNVIKIGIETGSEKILKDTKKGVTFEQMKQVAEMLNKNKVFWSGYFMVGLPQEDENDISKTLEFMRELNPYYAGLGIYNPFPGTELFKQGLELGLLQFEVGLEHFFQVNPKDYYFVNPNKRVLNIDEQKFNELVHMLMKEFHKHNTNFRNLLKRGYARKLAYTKDFKLLAMDLIKAMKWRLKTE